MIHRVIRPTYIEKWQHFQCMSADTQHHNDNHRKHIAISEKRHIYKSQHVT